MTDGVPSRHCLEADGLLGQSSPQFALAITRSNEVFLAVFPVAVPDFETIYDQYFRFVWISARRLGVGPDAIDDVVQEVFIVIHSKLQTVRQPESLRSWIYGIVRRTASGYRRAGRKQQDVFALTAEEGMVATGQPSPLDLTERRSQLELLSSLLASLSETKREVFILAELEEMTVPEIAAALEIPVNTAYSRLRHARQDFEAALARRVAASTRRGLA